MARNWLEKEIQRYRVKNSSLIAGRFIKGVVGLRIGAVVVEVVVRPRALFWTSVDGIPAPWKVPSAAAPVPTI